MEKIIKDEKCPIKKKFNPEKDKIKVILNLLNFKNDEQNKGLINEKKNDVHEKIEKDKISPENEINKNNSSDIKNLQIFEILNIKNKLIFFDK